MDAILVESTPRPLTCRFAPPTGLEQVTLRAKINTTRQLWSVADVGRDLHQRQLGRRELGWLLLVIFGRSAWVMHGNDHDLERGGDEAAARRAAYEQQRYANGGALARQYWDSVHSEARRTIVRCCCRSAARWSLVGSGPEGSKLGGFVTVECPPGRPATVRSLACRNYC
jgi:hypothetical protein